MYEVHHSYPLNHQQKNSLAESITKLHSSTFTTPSFFVHIRFSAHDATDKNYYVAGKPRFTSTNRILGMVRTSSARSKSDFDTLAAKIEEAWYDALKGEMIEEGKDKGKRKGEVNETEQDREVMALMVVAFHPMIAAREAGMVIPEAGKEGTWLKDHMGYFKEMSDTKGLEEFSEMLKEIETREDLQKLVR